MEDYQAYGAESSSRGSRRVMGTGKREREDGERDRKPVVKTEQETQDTQASQEAPEVEEDEVCGHFPIAHSA